MAIYVKCPNPSCGKEYHLRDELAGKAVRCSQCNSIIRVPGGERGAPETLGLEPEEARAVTRARPITPTPAPPEVRTDPCAIWSLVLGILILCCSAFSGVPALVLGIISKNRIRDSRGTLKGKGMATAGIILGIIGIILFVLGLVLRLTGRWPMTAPQFRP